MNNPNKHIEEFLKYYFNLKKPPHYAVLLKGKWGVGKTWFLNNLIDSWKNTDYEVKTHLYISLYGVTSFDDIESEFFRQLHPVLSSKGMLLAGKVAKGFMKGMLKIDWDGDGKSDGSLTVQAPELNVPDYLSNTNGLVLVFDDLERASMDLEALLGYINHYVEHQGYKVILIANEEELFDGQKASDSNDESVNINIGYRRIKEKLIGKTFEVQPRLELAIKNFIQEIESEATKTLYESNLVLIKDLYQRSGYWNLRHLRQALMDFARLLDVISSDIKEKKGLIEHLLSTYLILSFEIKSGEILPTDINSIEESYLVELMYRVNSDEALRDKVDNWYVQFKDKYPAFDPVDMLLEKSIWIAIFDKGSIDKEKIEESLRSSRYFHNDNQPEWMRLWHCIYLNDQEFDELLITVKNDFKSQKVDDIQVVKHITGLFLEFSDEGLLNMTKSEIFELAKKNVDSLIKINSDVTEYYSGELDNTSSYGLSYYRSGDKEFQELVEYIDSVIKQKSIDSLPAIGRDLLNDIKTSPSEFRDKLYYDGKVNNYNQHPILIFIKPQDFVTSLLEIKPQERRDIILAISSRYKSLSDKRKVIPEIAWLQKVVQLLLSEATKRKGKVSGYQIELFTNAYLLPHIKTLQQESRNNRQARYYNWDYTPANINLIRTVNFF